VKVKLKEKLSDDTFSEAVKSLDSKEIKDMINQLNKEKNDTKRYGIVSLYLSIC
jgi:hypothetical protein